ncbi:MAG TPA: prepilin-type N-terminal cleavage/methylation domain-containing protein, partial [Thermoanaerobaculia bacterium]|nr:prepilin-type N-terminal cleavage/methylation domain-containing protein [Thermoanaerobaculia bacterium]
MRGYRRQHGRQHGFTLTEVMVATAIFTIIMLAALLMYDRNNRVFKSGVQASDVQQNTRIGFDKLVSDLRIEGFDYNRNGDVSGSDLATHINYQKLSDEQIEYMGDAAIAFRANFNYNTGYDNGREGNKRNPNDSTDTYEGPAFPLVTTSNSEIVIYALQSANPAKNTSVISFYADVSKPRAAYVGAGGIPAEKVVNITGYDTTNSNPPYTLYRLTLKDANLANNDPSPVGNAVPIATNIRSLKFTYYADQGGTAPDPVNGITPVYGAGQYDASNAQNIVAERSTRATIEAIRVDLIGMESAPENNYSSPLETSTGVTDTAGIPASKYREYRLTSLIVPRNVGKRAVKEEQLKQPQPATLKTICYGACSVPYLTWQAPQDGNVDFYAIVYDFDTNPPYDCHACSFSNGYPVGNVTEAYFPRPLSPGVKYFFKIEASNGYGDSLSQETASVTAINTTTPNPPASGAATTNLPNRVRLTWQIPTQYTGSPSLTCLTPLGGSAGSNSVAQNGIAPPESIAYRIYRIQGTANSGFDPSANQGELIASETSGSQPYIDVNGLATYDDYVPACTDFYYRIQAVAADCVGSTSYNSPAQTSIAMSTFLPDVSSPALHGKATSASIPATPQNFKVTRPSDCPPAGTLRGASITCNLQLSWDKVTQDTSSPAQPVKIDNYILTRTQIQPGSGTTTINVPGQWDTLVSGNAGNSITYTDANLPMTDSAGRSYEYTYSLVADTNSCSASSAAVTATEPSTYFSISGEPVTATTSDGGDGSLGSPYQLYGGSSTLIFKGTGLTGMEAYVCDASMNVITTIPGFASPFVMPIPTGLNTGQEYHVDFVATNGTGYYTETVYFVQQGGVCDYSAAPSAVPNPTQTNNGLTVSKPWSLQPGQTIKWTASDLASSSISIIDTSTNSVVKTFTPTGTTETLTWPTLTYGKTYEVDIILTSNINCQREQFYFVTQVCAAYGGGTPAFTVSDATHTGLTSASAWQIVTGGTINVTESSMKSLKVTVTDLTANKAYTTATYTATAGVVTITWPPTGVTAANNDVFQMDLVLVDSNGCTSSTYTRYVTQYCAYSGGTPTITATQTLRNTTDAVGSGTVSTSPFLMVPNVDMITITEAQVKTAYIDYLDTSGNALAGVTTQTWTGSSPLKFSNPIISSYNGKTYRIDITLADSNGCKTTTKYTYYVKQVPCVLKPQQTASDTSIISALFNPTGNGSNLANRITLFNKTTQQITITGVTLT